MWLLLGIGCGWLLLRTNLIKTHGLARITNWRWRPEMSWVRPKWELAMLLKLVHGDMWTEKNWEKLDTSTAGLGRHERNWD